MEGKQRQRTKRWEGREESLGERRKGERERERERERGVHVSHSANKQKVNTGGGNTVSPDAAHRSSTCPLRFPRRPFCQPQDKSSAKSQHLFPPGALGDNRGKKAIQHLCLLRLKHVAFPPSLPRGNSTDREMQL